MLSHISYKKTFAYLFMRSLKIITPFIPNKMINSAIWSMLNVIIFAYVMPSVGLKSDFGNFILTTMPASCGFFTSIHAIYTLVNGVTTEGSNLSYELTLPLPQWMVFSKYIFENMYQSLMVSIIILPWGKLLLWNKFSLEHVSFIKFYLLLVAASLFYGCFSVFIASIVKNLYSGLDNIWIRIIFPMWFLGGFQFSWKTLYSISPVLAYINLLNPLTYALEGSRAATLDPQLSLPFWYCFTGLMIASCLFGYQGISNLKKRLDCL